MTLNVSPQIEAKLYHVAKQEGIDAAVLVEKMFREYQTTHINPADKNREAINLLRSWREEDNTDDETELERRDQETAQLMQNLATSRVSFEVPKL